MSLAQFMNQDSCVSLESHLERISLESEFLVNMLETFKTAIPSFVSKLRDANAHLFETAKAQDTLDIELSKKEKKALEYSKHLDFVGFGDRLISVPENFKGDYIKYAALLNTIATIAYQTQNTILAEYNQILSAFITNKEDKISLKDHTAFFNRIKAERESYTEKLGDFLNKKSGVSKMRFRDVISRMADLETLIHHASHLGSQHSRAKLHDINSSVNHSVDLLDLVVNGVQDGTIKNISPNATMNISRGAYEVAKYVEFVGLIYFDITVFLNSVNSMLDSILDTRAA